jgi:hypothetical protein
MLSFTRIPRRSVAALAAIALLLMSAAPALAHEARTVAGYDMEVGMINEPVFVGDRSGLEFSVMKDGQPVTGLDATIKASVAYNGATRDLPISARDGADGWYQSVFIPTAAGGYSFHLTGTINGQAIDETFNATPTGYGPVEEASANQFPTQLPSIAALADQAAKGAAAANQVTIALGVGAAGLIVGLIGLGVALASRRRRS